MHNFLNLALAEQKDSEIVATTRQELPQGRKGRINGSRPLARTIACLCQSPGCHGSTMDRGHRISV